MQQKGENWIYLEYASTNQKTCLDTSNLQENKKRIVK